MFPHSEIEEKIGYKFRDKKLLEEAFTHSTYANEYGGKDNERMEYLGDAVLQLVVTEWQYAKHKRASEGELTRERQKLVCEDSLYQAVQTLHIKRYLRIYGGRDNVGKKTVSSLFETVIASIYLDSGYEQAKAFIVKHLLSNPQTAEEENAKGALQEFVQRSGEKLPEYETEKTGKDNAPVFVAKVRAMGKTAVGEGKSKRQAEQSSASKLLRELKKSRKTTNQVKKR